MQNTHIDTYNLFDDDIMNAAYKRRDEWAANDALRDADFKVPEGVTKIVDIPYTESLTEKESVWHTLDVYYPPEKMDLYPVIVNIHGGGWFYGSKEVYKPYSMYLASLGFAVVNFNYRRSPEYKYPAAFIDVLSVLDFVYMNNEKYHFDMTKLFIVGDSAGAQLASQYCIYATSEAYRNIMDEVMLNTYNAKACFTNPLPKGVALNCGIYNMWDVLSDDTTKWYIPQTDDTLLLQSFTTIMDYLNSNFPPTFLMASVNDPLRSHSLPMKQNLDSHQVANVYMEYGQDNPEDAHVFHLNLKSEAGQLCNHEQCRFFQELISKN